MTSIRKTAAIFLYATLLVVSGLVSAASDKLQAEYDRLLKRQAAAEAKVHYAEADPFVRARLGLERKLPSFTEWRAQHMHDTASASPPVPKRRIAAAPVTGKAEVPTSLAAPAAAPALAATTVPPLGAGEEFVVDERIRHAESPARGTASDVRNTPTTAPPPRPAEVSAALQAVDPHAGSTQWSRPGLFLVAGLITPLWAVLAFVHAFRRRPARGDRSGTRQGGHEDGNRHPLLRE